MTARVASLSKFLFGLLCWVSLGSSAYCDPQASLPEDVQPGSTAESECHAIVGRRGPGNYSLYGNGPRTNDLRWVNWIQFWMSPTDDPNRFDPTKHLVPDCCGGWGASPSAPPPTAMIYIDPCNRNYGNLWNCRLAEGSNNSKVTYSVGQVITWVDPEGATHNLLDEPLNQYRYPAAAGVGDKTKGIHWERTGFRPAKSTYCQLHIGGQVSPLVVDLGGAGIEFTNPEQIVRFDLGQTSGTISWIANPNSVAFLALDINENGVIDSAFELFGDQTLGADGQMAGDGFKALGKHDKNLDGAINSRDEIFNKLLLWQDKNINGRTDSGELSPARDRIVSISLVHDDQMYFKDARDNYAKGKAIVDLVKGEKASVYDAWFTPGETFSKGSPKGTLGHVPAKDSAQYAKVSADLKALLKEDGWDEKEAVFERGVQYTDGDKMTLRWTIGNRQECIAQLIYNASWNLKDKLVSCE